MKLTAPSKKPSMDFSISVCLKLKVSDAARVVKQGITDPESLFTASLNRVVCDQAQNYDIGDMAGAKRAIEAALRELRVDPAISIVDAAAEVKADAAALALLRSVAEEQLVRDADEAKARTEKARRDHILEILDHPEAIIAQNIVTKDDSFKEALNYKLRQLEGNREQQFRLLTTLIEKGVIEAHDLDKKYSAVLESLMHNLAVNSGMEPVQLSETPSVAAIEAKKDK